MESGQQAAAAASAAAAVSQATELCRKRSLSTDGSPLKRLRSASEAMRANNPFKKFSIAGRLPLIPRQKINGGTPQVTTYIDTVTNAPVPFNKASQKSLREFRCQLRAKKKLGIPSFLEGNAVRFELHIADNVLIVKEVLGHGGCVQWRRHFN